MPAGNVHRIPYDEFERSHSSSVIAHRLRNAIERASARVAVSPSSRVGRWQEPLERFGRLGGRAILEQMVPSLRRRSWDHPNRDCLRALVDSRMFSMIVEQLLADVSEDGLRDLIRGNFHPEVDRPDARTRDREFELFIAAIARRAGLSVRLAEPDVLVELGGEWLSIAAKRVSNSGMVETNLRRAARQIRLAQRLGSCFSRSPGSSTPITNSFWTGDEPIKRSVAMCSISSIPSTAPRYADGETSICAGSSFAPHSRFTRRDSGSERTSPSGR